ncbi:MAG: hypothetical protein HGA47_07365 [Zoogloea sp.]|nr:hypothetical protein [Zoogloea sp.]
MNLRTLIPAVAIATLVTGTCYADGPDSKANYFSNLYASLCMKNLNDLEALRTSLVGKGLPRFPPEQAGLFLRGNAGDAWPVPFDGTTGNFVVALFSDKSFCAVYARRATQADVERQFVQLVGTAPAPLVSEVKQDATANTGRNGKTHTISYTWSLPQAHRKMLFTLTTANSEDAQLQAMASAAMINE